VGHSPDVDLVAEINGVALRIEVKTATNRGEEGRWNVHLATKGGNQSWSGVAKFFDKERCDFVFVDVGDGRRWFIPCGAIDGRSGLVLGGPKYSKYEVDRGRPLAPIREKPGLNSAALGEYGSGQTGGAVNAMAQSFGGSNPPSPISSPARVKPTNAAESGSEPWDPDGCSSSRSSCPTGLKMRGSEPKPGPNRFCQPVRRRNVAAPSTSASTVAPTTIPTSSTSRPSKD